MAASNPARRVMIGLVTLLLSAGSASAQSSSADYLKSRVHTSQTVWVTASDGIARQGRVAAISDSQFEVTILGAVTAFPWADIRAIEVKDSLKNGTILGGIIGGLALAQMPSPRTAGNVSAWAALGIGLGAAAGAYADYLREGRDTIFRNSAPFRNNSPTASITAILFRDVMGLRAVLRW